MSAKKMLESMVVEEKSDLGGKHINREKTCPLLLRVFCNTGRHHMLGEYEGKNVPANELQIYTWMDATLREITSLIKEVKPEACTKGTVFDFALVVPHAWRDTFRARDIGQTISGQKGPDDNKSLSQLRFKIGDFLDIAISPPNHHRVAGPMEMGNGGQQRYTRPGRQLWQGSAGYL